ncbi:MAG: ABC transporter substrate-binding protein [Spirochaetales bacterium]|nr:ABC transporter substrate-binding protein [Spirochaetales bacterium]
MKKLVVAMVLLSLASLLIAGGARSESPTTPSGPSDRNGGVLVFARSGDSVSLDPGRETDGESFYPATAIFDTLVEFKPGTTEVQPALAESWDVSADGLTYTFNLRSGVTFHDGTPFNADAVKFTFERMFIETHPAAAFGPYKYWGYMDMSNIVESIDVVSGLQVRFNLKKPEAPFVANLAMDFAAIVSPTAVIAKGADFAFEPIGTGPFKFVQWIKDDNIIVEKNTNYWRRPAYLDRIIFKVIPDATARYLALQKGEVDIIDFPSIQDLADMQTRSGIKLINQEGLNVGYLAFNNDREPFGNKLVRQALNYAVNKQEIIDAVYGQAGTAAKNPIPPGMWSYNDDVEDYPYDPAQARALLAEAGYPNGFTTTIWAMPVVRPYNPNGRKVAEILQANFAAVGVQAEIVSYEWGTYLDKTDTGEHDMALLGWTGDNGDPDNFLNVLLSIPAATPPAGNIAFWRNEEFNDLIQQAKEEPDQARRTALYEEAQVIFKEEAPWITLAHSLVYSAMRDEVMDFVLYPTGKRVFYDVWLNE